MQELDFQPEMVGRDGEMRELEAFLDAAANGRGSMLFVSGEAGIGKTRLLNELKEVARSKGFLVLSGNSTFESLTHYMPFTEALKSGGLDSLFAEGAPKVEGIYLVSRSGLLVGESQREATQLDSDIFASMLTSVSSFVKDTLSMMSGREREGSLNVLGYERYRIVIEAGTHANLVAVLTGEENEFLINDMREALAKVDARYGGILKDWDGDKEPLAGVEEIIGTLITSGKYDGIYYAKENPEIRRYMLFENVSLGLRRQAQSKPLLLCIEDAQWADPSTLALMHYVARNTRRSRVLILCTYRPEDIVAKEGAAHPLTEARQLMNREELAGDISLQRLSRESVSLLLSSLFGKADFSDELKDKLHMETEGNPLFIIELAKLLVMEDVIKFHGGKWALVKGLEEVNIPSKVYDVIRRRLDRLKEDERETLDYAAVIGGEFTSKVLARATGLERVQLLRQLRKLEQTHRLIRSHEARYAFDHTKIKEVLYGELPLELRREYHSIIARSIEELNKEDPDRVIGDLAFHYYRSRDVEKAVPSLLRAAEIARKEFANTEAIRFCTEALDLIGGDRRRARERLGALEQLSEVYQLTGQYDKVTRVLEEIRAATDDKATISKTYRTAGAVLEKKGDYDRALEELSRSASIIGGAETVELGRITAFKATVHMRKGDYQTALQLCEESLRIYREHPGDERDFAQVHNVMGILHSYKGEYDDALEDYGKSLAIRERIGDRQGIASCLTNIGIVHYYRGEYAEALDYTTKALAITEKIGDQRGVMATLVNISGVLMREREYARALESLDKSLAIAERIGDRKGIAACLNNIGGVDSERGEYDKALENFKRGLEITEKIGDRVGIADNLSNMGFVYKGMGERDRALENLRKAEDLYERIGDRGGMGRCCCAIAEVLLRAGELREAADSGGKAYRLAAETGSKQNAADSKKVLGMILREQGKWDESAESFEESVRLFSEIKVEKELGEAFLEFGLMWKKKGELRKAAEMLREAEGLFEKLRLEKSLGKAREALRGLT